jgi:hypothetical protein
MKQKSYRLWFEDDLKRRWYVLTVPENEGKDYMYTRKVDEALRVGSRWKSRFLNYKRSLAEKAGVIEDE